MLFCVGLFFFLPRSSFGLNYDNYILIFSPPSPSSSHPRPACTQTQMGIMCSEYDLNSTAWDPCLALSSLYSSGVKKAPSTPHSFITLEWSRAVRLLVWVPCPWGELIGKTTFQTCKRGGQGTSVVKAGCKQHRVCEILHEYMVCKHTPPASFLHKPRLADVSGQHCIWLVCRNVVRNLPFSWGCVPTSALQDCRSLGHN